MDGKHLNTCTGIYDTMWTLWLDCRRGVATCRRLFKTKHNMVEERSLRIKAPNESKVERSFRGTRGRGWGWGIGICKWAPYFNFMVIKVVKLFLKSQMYVYLCLVKPQVATPQLVYESLTNKESHKQAQHNGSYQVVCVFSSVHPAWHKVVCHCPHKEKDLH